MATPVTTNDVLDAIVKEICSKHHLVSEPRDTGYDIVIHVRGKKKWLIKLSTIDNLLQVVVYKFDTFHEWKYLNIFDIDLLQPLSMHRLDTFFMKRLR